MAIPYTNARYGQAFMGTLGNNLGLSQTYVYPLAPDPDAYSVGPPAGTYPDRLSFEFRTSNYLAEEPTQTSKSTLVKDENNIFYYICSYKSGSNPTTIYIDVYDAPNDTSVQYLPTVPTEFTTDFSQDAISNQCWFISRRNATEIDFIVVGDDINYLLPGAKVIIHQYRWTIGSSTLTYITKYEYLADGSVGSLGKTILGMALIDGQIIIMTKNRQISPPNYYWYIVEFPIDGAGSYYEFTSTAGKLEAEAAFFPAGSLVHIFAIYAIGPTATQGCIGYLGAPWTMNIEAQIWTAGRTYGSESYNYNEQITTYSGRQASAGSCTIWPEYSCNPDTGQVYFRLQFGGAGSDDIDCNECPLAPVFPCGPETTYATRAYWTLPANEAYAGWDESVAYGGSITWDKTAGEYQEPGWWGNMPSDTWFRFSFPHRTHPSSFMYAYTGISADYSYILEWPTLDVTAVDVLCEYNQGCSKITEGAGQRNDNGSPLIGYEYNSGTSWWTVFVDLDGTEYARINTFMGQINNPMTGFIGNYAVYEKQGKWMIYGPMPPPTATVRWQVV